MQAMYSIPLWQSSSKANFLVWHLCMQPLALHSKFCSEVYSCLFLYVFYCRMALVEFQDFKLNQQPIIFADASELQVFEDLLGAMELPTPPLSPDHAEEALSTDSSHQTEETELDVGETILEKMIDSENMVFDSQSTHCSEDMLDVDPMLLSNPQALLQDCMWSCGDYEPRHSLGYTNGVYTPAPSPSPEAKQALEEDSEEAETIATFGVDKSAEEEPAECISPNEVLVFTGTVECTTPGAQSKTAAEEGQQEPTVNTRKASLSYRRSVSSVSSGSSRLHPQATSSESGENMCIAAKAEPVEDHTASPSLCWLFWLAISAHLQRKTLNKCLSCQNLKCIIHFLSLSQSLTFVIIVLQRRKLMW